MKMNNIAEFKDTVRRSERSEEVQYILERMPTKFGLVVSILTISLFIILVVFGFVVSYPDVVTGNITINAEHPPIKMIAFSSGKIRLLKKSQQKLKAGELITYLENPADFRDVNSLKESLKSFKILNPSDSIIHTEWVLGELTPKYYRLISAVQNYRTFYSENLYEKEREDLEISIAQGRQSLQQLNQQLNLIKSNVALTLKAFQRDSILFRGKVESEAEFERSRMNYYNVKKNYHDGLTGIYAQERQIADNFNKLQQTAIEKKDKEQSIKTELASAYNDLLEELSAWQQKFEFISPISGTVQFLDFWRENQFVAQGQEIFSIISKENKPSGELILPSSGAGKVKIGQEVIIKLENYPYQQYGTIKGRVESISLTTNLARDRNNSSVNNYLVSVTLPNLLKTNFGSTLDFKSELKGSADIITKDRKFVSRLFDNLRNEYQR
jgi:multidrug efflux pump subunit AcrA (membrane-fusion protein)